MAERIDSNMRDGADASGTLDASVLRHFGFAINPFSVEHDPKFLLRSKPIRNALESLHQAVGEGSKLLLVASEPGGGKAALVDAIAREFKDGVRTAILDRPSGTWPEIGEKLGTALRLPGGRLSPAAMAANAGAAQTYRVIVNHADQMSVDSIKHFAAYLDLQAAPGTQVHRLQVILLANEEMGAPLKSWLSQRDHSRIELCLLDGEQTRRYVTRRTQLATSTKSEIFLPDALPRIAQMSGGNPGEINRVCRASLALAASRGSETVDAETVGTVVRRGRGSSLPELDLPEAPAPLVIAQPTRPPELPAPVVVPPAAPAPVTPVVHAPPADASVVRVDQGSETYSRSARVEVVTPTPPRSENRSVVMLGTFCALLLGVIAGGIGFFYFQPPPVQPPPVTQIIEVPVEKIVEVPVEVPVEVVKIVKVEVPRKAKPRPPQPKPRPKRVARVAPPAKPAPAPPPVPKTRKLGPVPPAAAVLDRAFSRARPSSHSRRVEIVKHIDGEARLVQTLDLARVQQQSRTLTLGVLTGDVSSDSREVESRFLSIETGQLEDERFGFRPARGKVEALKGGKGRDPFYGSAFHYDDFRVRSSGQYVIHGIDRSRVGNKYFYSVSAKPRFDAYYQRVEFTIDAADEVLVEAHYFRGLGLRPYRVVQFPRDDMEAFGSALVPMRIISRNFESGAIEEARVVKVALDDRLDARLFTLGRIKTETLAIPNL